MLVRSYKDTNSFERFMAEVYFSARPSVASSWPDSVDHVAVSGRIWWSLGKGLVWEGLGK